MAIAPSSPHLPIVDAHHHLWDLSVRSQPWLESSAELAPLRKNYLLPDLVPLAAAAGVTASVVVQTVTDPGETAELQALAARSRLIAAVVGWTDLAAPAVADSLSALRGLPGGEFLVGIRHPLLTEPDPEWIARPEVRRGLADLAAAGLAFDLVLRPTQLPVAVAAAAAVPQLTFVLDHLGNAEIESRVDPDWAAAMTRFAALPNTVCKLSGVLAEPGPLLLPYFDFVISRFGAERIMFGSDWPVCTLRASYPAVVSAARTLVEPLSPDEQHAVLAGTARRVYQISGG